MFHINLLLRKGENMNKLKEIFSVKVSKDQLQANLYLNDSAMEIEKTDITFDKLLQFVKDNNIKFGINEAVIKEIAENYSPHQFPVQIAEGIASENGIDGKLESKLDLNTEVDRSEGWDFREVLRIPTVKVEDELATIIPPTQGKNGKNVFGKEILARPGKPILMRPGKNVKYNEENKTFYATAEGQVNFGSRAINVYTVYEVHENISMKTGNIDFSGSVVIRGDVPTGFTVKATGDIKIFGLVEAAQIIAEGSVFISEGIAGLKTGIIKAGEDVHIGYINQGIVTAGNSILVENSILHSECSAGLDIICQRGNIIGGTSSVGRSIHAKDIGNRMNTLTQLSLGVDKKLYDEQVKLEAEKDSLTDNLAKLKLLREKLDTDTQLQTSQNRITLLKLRHSYNKTQEQLEEIESQLASINASLGSMDSTFIKVKGTIFPNVVVSFGKYRRTIDREFDNVMIKMEKNDIAISPY